MMINLGKFSGYPGALHVLFPKNIIGKIIVAIADGDINRNGAVIVLEKWLEQIHSVGFVDGRPVVRWRTNIE